LDAKKNSDCRSFFHFVSVTMRKAKASKLFLVQEEVWAPKCIKFVGLPP